MRSTVTFSQVRRVLTDLGFQLTRRRPNVVGLEHPESDTLFLFRPYKDTDRVTPAEVVIVRKMLDEKGLLEPDAFEELLTKAPA